MTLRIQPEARADMQTAIHWYEERQPGWGLIFLDDVEAVFQRIEQGPARYPMVHHGLRRTLAHRFPFAI
jgi:toxin ParE1/3/4